MLNIQISGKHTIIIILIREINLINNIIVMNLFGGKCISCIFMNAIYRCI